MWLTISIIIIVVAAIAFVVGAFLNQRKNKIHIEVLKANKQEPIIKIVPTEAWEVRWKRAKSNYGILEFEEVIRVFTNKEEAENFKKSLDDANRLLQHSLSINSKINKLT